MGTITTANPSFASTSIVGRPIEDGNGNWYMVYWTNGTSRDIGVYKSTDGGSNWTEQDTSNRPNESGFDVRGGFSWVQDGTTIHIVVEASTGGAGKDAAGAYDYFTFEMSDSSGTADAWNISESIDTPSWGGTESIQKDGPDIAVRSDGDVVVVYRIADRTSMGTDYTQVGYAVRTGVATWSTNNSLSASNENQTTPRCVLGASDDTHIIYTTTSCYGDTLSSADSLAGRAVVRNSNNFTVRPVYFTPSGGSATLAFNRPQDDYNFIVESSWPASMATENYDDTVAGGSSTLQRAAAWDSGSNAMFVLYGDNATADVQYDYVRNGDTSAYNFANTTELVDAVTTEGLWAVVFDNGDNTSTLVVIYNNSGTLTSATLDLLSLEIDHYDWFDTFSQGEDTRGQITNNSGTGVTDYLAFRVSATGPGGIREVSSLPNDIQYRINGGSWTTITSSGNVRYAAGTGQAWPIASFITTGDVGKTDVNGHYYETSGNDTIELQPDQETEVMFELSFDSNALSLNDLIEFRLNPATTGVKDNGTYGEVEIVSGGPPPVTFSGDTTGASTTGNGTLVVDHNFSGDTTAASTTGNATLALTHGFTGSTTAASTTGAATLDVISTVTFSGETTAASTTGNGTIAIVKSFSGSTTAASTTGVGTLVRTATLSGDTTGASTTGTGTLAVDHNFSGSTTAASTTGAGALAVDHNFSGATTAASTTGDGILSTAKTFSGSTTAASTTGNATLDRTRGFSGETTAASTGGNGTLLRTAVLTGADATAASTTGNGTLDRTATFSGSTVAASTTGDATLVAGSAVTFTGATTAASTGGNGTLVITLKFSGDTITASTTGNATALRTANYSGDTTAASVTGSATFIVTENDRSAQVTWTEFELPDAGRSALITWSELELGDAARVGRVTWSEFEIPDAGRTAQITWSELEVGDAGRAAIVSWSEMEFPAVDFSAIITWAEFEVPNVGGSLSYSDVARLDELGILRKMSERKLSDTEGDRLALYRKVSGGNGDVIAALNSGSKELIGAINEQSGDASATELLEALRNWAVSDTYN